ncbi:MAG: ATP-binding protein [Bacteroidota bacterium]|nr:ATP-binding protein [Bacteroidota bacterium]
MIFADKVHISSIIANLIDNANKYTPENPRITVSTKDQKEGVMISVEDNGIGITPENQKQIFRKLYRVPTGNLHDVKGFGLGLYYVKTMVEAHEGFIRIHSEFGKGSRFDVYLPISNQTSITHEEEQY